MALYPPSLSPSSLALWHNYYVHCCQATNCKDGTEYGKKRFHLMRTPCGREQTSDWAYENPLVHHENQLAKELSPEAHRKQKRP